MFMRRPSLGSHYIVPEMDCVFKPMDCTHSLFSDLVVKHDILGQDPFIFMGRPNLHQI